MENHKDNKTKQSKSNGPENKNRTYSCPPDQKYGLARLSIIQPSGRVWIIR